MLKKIVLAAALAVLGLANLAGTDAEANGYTGYGWRHGHGHVVSFKKHFHGYGHGHGYGHKVYVPQHKAYGYGHKSYGHNVYGFQHKPAFWFSYGHNRRWH